MSLGMWKHVATTQLAYGAGDGDALNTGPHALLFRLWQRPQNTGNYQETMVLEKYHDLWSCNFYNFSLSGHSDPRSKNATSQSSSSLSEAYVLKNNWLFLTVQHQWYALQAQGWLSHCCHRCCLKHKNQRSLVNREKVLKKLKQMSSYLHSYSRALAFLSTPELLPTVCKELHGVWCQLA